MTITKVDLPTRDAMLRWLLFAVVAGVVVNSQEGEPPKTLLIAAVLVASGLLGGLLWLALLGRGVLPVSGISIDLKNDFGFSMAVLIGLWVVTCVGFAVCALARPVAIQVLRWLAGMDLDKARKVESVLKVVLSIAGTAALAFLALAS